jgi:murein DD-endopeptidase MepM/ murein hydrolase activator NlpD
MNLDIDSFINDIKSLFQAKKEYQSGNTKSIEPEIKGSSGFQVPIKSEYHNSGGFDPSGKGSVGRVHQGLDLRAPGGSAIYPIAPGMVTAVQPDPKGGNTVNVRHANGVTSYYAHMGSIEVHPGDKVDLNTKLGTVGASGNAKGFPHLHLQVWRDGKLIDPASVISVPTYTVYDAKKEKLWVPGAKEVADNWNMQEHLSKSKTRMASSYNEIIKLANKFENKY